MTRDLSALFAVILAALIFFDPPLPWIGNRVIYVSPRGSDWNRGKSPEQAVATIQRAADLVAPGGTVVILPGVYREDVRIRRGGEAGRPVVFRARQPGTVTISGAAADDVVSRLQWRDEGDRIWSSATPWPVHHVVGDGMNFYHVRWAKGSGDSVYYWVGKNGRVDILRRLMKRPKPWGAFTYENGRLYLAFPDGRSPKDHDLVIHRPIPRPYASWTVRSANVWLEADHVRFEGIRFFLGVGAGLILWDARDVTVSDCLFTGANFGISNFPTLKQPDDLVVEHSLYHNYPQYFWSREWLSYGEIYSHHAFSTLVCAAGDGIIARYNLVTHSADGLELSTPDTEIVRGVRIYGNFLVRGTDDAIEFDGFAKRVSFHDNLIYDHYDCLSLSPVLAGPVLIRDNIVLGPSSPRKGAHFKLMNPWLGRHDGREGPNRNIIAEGNLFQGKWLCFKSGSTENVQVRGNIFADVAVGQFGFPEGVTESENIRLGDVVAVEGPEAYCRLKRRLSPAQGCRPLDALFARLADGDKGDGRFGSERPGPSWYEYESSPATSGLNRLVAPWLGGWKCD